MYWVTTGSDRIERASMDGMATTALHTTSLTSAYGLAIDIDSQTLYWTDLSRNVIEKSNTDGTGRTTVLSRMLSDPYFITYYDGILYWTDWGYNRLLSTPLNSTSNVAYFGPSIGADAYGIQIITPDKQRQGKNNKKCP